MKKSLNISTNIYKNRYLIHLIVFLLLVLNSTFGQTVHQYSTSDLTALKTDINAGTYDIYELTTSGGAYEFTTALTPPKNFTLKAVSGLAAKPVISINTASTSSTLSMFYPGSGSTAATAVFEGVELSGVNSGSTTQPMLYYARYVANSNLIFRNCYIHDFTHGTACIRYDLAGGNIDMQGTVVSNLKTKFVNFFNAVVYGSINLKNCTFNNLINPSSGTSYPQIVLFRTGASGTTATINHCTFNNSTSSSSLFTFLTMNSISVKNSVFKAINGGFAYPSATIDSSYVAGFATAPTATTSYLFGSPVPLFEDANSLKFGLTNGSSFICADGLPVGNTIYYPAAPLASAATSVSSTGFAAYWGAVANITNYKLDVATDNNFSNILSNYNGLTVSGTTKNVTSLSPNTNYYYRVRSFNGVESVNSNVISLISGITNSLNASDLPPCSACNITLGNGAELTVDKATTFNSITAAPGAKITMNSNYTLSASNGITLQSDENGTATLVDNNTTNPQSVTATVQQYVTEGRNWYLSIPLTSVSASSLNKGTSVVMYDEPTGQWVAPDLNTLDKMRGYIQTATPLTGATGTVEFSGALNTGAQSITLSRTAGKTGFNLMGNPYPSYLDWNMVTKTNVSNTMWYRTKEGSVYKFYTYIANEGAGIGVPASITNKIPPMQAFWVRVVNEGTGSIAVDNNMRSHKDVSGNIMRARKQESQPLIRLQVSNGINNDETVIYFNANASNSFDRYDAQKRSNDNPAIPEIFTQINSERLVINGLPEIEYNKEIPIGFTAGNENLYSIKLNEFSNFPSNTHIILKDGSIEFDLTNGISYEFNSKSANDVSRFSIIFKSSNLTTDVESGIDNEFNKITVKANGQINIKSALSSDVCLDIYDSVGRRVISRNLTQLTTSIDEKLKSGTYLMRLSNKEKKCTKKIVVD